MCLHTNRLLVVVTLLVTRFLLSEVIHEQVALEVYGSMSVWVQAKPA
jgi:hypothetical protein